MSRTSSSRARKQNFSPNNSSSFFTYNDDMDSDEGSQGFHEEDSPPRRVNRTAPTARKVSDPRDRQSQLDHNEQERGRRRELAIIYEMIRTCITEDDIRRHLDGTAKSADKLSYPQLLQISCGKIQDELHDQRVLRNLFREIENLENLCDEYNISYDKKRPAVPSMERHKIIAEVVEEVLNTDKRSRNFNGEYVMSQRARALIAHNKLKDLLADVNKLVSVSQTSSYQTPLSVSRENRPIGPIRNRQIRRTQRRSRRPIYERRQNVIERLPSPPPAPVVDSPDPSSLPDSNLTPEDIEQVIDQFPFPSPPPPTEDIDGFSPLINQIEFPVIQDRMLSEHIGTRFDENVSSEEAAMLLREFEVQEDNGFDSLLGLVGGVFDLDPFEYFP